MDPWTPEDRNDFIRTAINSEEQKGHKGPYTFSVFSKNGGGNENEDFRRSLLTDALAKTIYNTKPSYRKLSLGFYETLYSKLATNIFTAGHMNSNIVLLLKGGNAYAFVTQELYPEDFPFSDLDIVIYINPYLDQHVFNELEKAVRIIVLQTLSQYKRLLDHMLFLNKPVDGRILSEDVIQEFKNDYTKMLEDITLPDGASFLSPFTSDEIRNYCSKNSFLITKSQAKENSVVRVEVPHYDRCERIPLRRTPFFSSYNQTIDFMRDSTGYSQGHFDLYRIRFNNMYVEKDEEGKIVKEERVPADFIDVSIASKNDAELLDFWNKGRCLYVYDKNANLWIMMPDIQSCIADLHKMLNVYDCPDSKRAKRQQKYNKLLMVLTHKT